MKIERIINGQIGKNKNGSYLFIRKKLSDLIKVNGNSNDVNLIESGNLGKYFYDNGAKLFLPSSFDLKFPDIKNKIQKYNGKIYFLGIETEGLAYRSPIFMISSMNYFYGQNPSSAEIEILFARDYSEEGAILYEANEKIRGDDLIVTHNGATFDLRRLSHRMLHNCVPFNRELFSVEVSAKQVIHDGLICLLKDGQLDTLPYSSECLRHKIQKVNLKTIEEFIFDFKRKKDLAGEGIVKAYHNFIYREIPDKESLQQIKRIFDHNVLDVLSLASLFTYLSELRK
jgi:uncharacterized protein YprB with RNaseH-like and TPR domain